MDKDKCNARIQQPKVEYEGYHFHLNKSHGDTMYYECSFRKEKNVKCQVRLRIKNDNYISTGLHNHSKPIFQLADVRKAIEQSHPGETSRSIKRRIVSTCDNVLDLTNIRNVERSIQRFRKKKCFGQTPKDLNGLKTSLENKNWSRLIRLDETKSFTVEFVIKNNDVRAVIFIDTNLINKITKTKDLTIFIDGTFATVPQLNNDNCQLWTIVIRYNDRTFPIVYTIMQGRTTENYVQVFRKICSIEQFYPVKAVADFERAEWNALKIAFPGIQVIGCFFHYSQALVHNAKKLNILKGEQKETGYGAVRLLISLALIPESLIEEGFYIISTVILKDCKYLESFLNYYHDTWIKGFKPESFCVYKEHNRTNNVSERHNRELKESLNKHSTIVAFLENLTEHQRGIHSMLNHPTFWARPQSDIFKRKEEILTKIWQKFENTQIDLLLILYELSELVGTVINL